MKEEGLKVVGVTTSSQTTAQAEVLVFLKAVDDIDVIDVTVDGADEVDKTSTVSLVMEPFYGKSLLQSKEYLGC